MLRVHVIGVGHVAQLCACAVSQVLRKRIFGPGLARAEQSLLSPGELTVPPPVVPRTTALDLSQRSSLDDLPRLPACQAQRWTACGVEPTARAAHDWGGT